MRNSENSEIFWEIPILEIQPTAEQSILAIDKIFNLPKFSKSAEILIFTDTNIFMLKFY